VAGQVGDLLGQLLRLIEVMNHEPAVFARRFDRDIAHAEHPLHERLDNPDVLHFGELDESCRLGGHTGFIAKLIASDREFYGLPLNMALYRPEEENQP